MTLLDDTQQLPVTTAPLRDDVQVVLPVRRLRGGVGLRALGKKKVSTLIVPAACLLMAVAIVTGFASWISGAYTEPRQQAQFAKYSSTALPLAEGAIRDAWPKGVPVALLRIPRYNKSLAVGVGVSKTDLRDGPGFAPETAFPGKDGNTVIVGKSSTYGSPFNDIGTLKEGDQLILTSMVGTFAYQVTGVTKVKSNDKTIAEESTTSRLSLVTHSGGMFSHKATLVRADRVIGDVESKNEPPPVPPTREDGFAPIIFMAILALIAALVWGLRQGLGGVISKRTALWLVCPVLLALSLPLMMQVLLLLPRAY
jgi:sortase A